MTSGKIQKIVVWNSRGHQDCLLTYSFKLRSAFDEVVNRISLPVLHTAVGRKLQLFGHTGRSMSDERKLNTVVFGMTDENNTRGRPHKE